MHSVGLRGKHSIDLECDVRNIFYRLRKYVETRNPHYINANKMCWFDLKHRHSLMGFSTLNVINTCANSKFNSV